MAAWRIGEILVQKKLITWDELDEALEEQKNTQKSIGEILLEKGKIIKHWRKVPKADAHPAKVLEFLQSL